MTGIVSAAVCVLFMLLILFSASYLPYNAYAGGDEHLRASETVQRYWWCKPGGHCG